MGSQLNAEQKNLTEAPFTNTKTINKVIIFVCCLKLLDCLKFVSRY